MTVAFKPNLIFVPGLLAVHWVLNGEIRRLGVQAGSATVTAVVAILLAAVTFGSFHAWIAWLVALRSLPPEINPVRYGNFALIRLSGEWLGVDMAVPFGLLFAGVLVLALWLRRLHESEPPSEVLVASAGCLLIVLTTRIAWLHYYVFAIPAMLTLLAAAPRFSARAEWINSLIVASALLGYSTDWLVNLGLLQSPETQGVLVILATVLVYGAIVARLYGAPIANEQSAPFIAADRRRAPISRAADIDRGSR